MKGGTYQIGDRWSLYHLFRTMAHINARGEKGKKNSALIITWGDEYKPIRICVNLPTNILLCISSHASPLE